MDELEHHNRPLDEVKDQSQAVSFLKDTHRTGRYPRAMMFYGPPGTGKCFCAKQFAKHINMREDDPEWNQRVTDLIDDGEHPDVQVFSKGDSNSFKIDKVREALEEAKRPLVEANMRVLIFEDIQDFPSYKQSDALLKTIEDGYDDTIFILTTTDRDEVVSTLKSRTIPVSFGPLGYDVLADVLSDSSGEKDFEVALRLSKGSLDRARRLLRPPSEDCLSGLQLRKRAIRLLRLLPRTPSHKIVAFLNKIDKDDAAYFLDILAAIVRDVLLLEEEVGDRLTNEDVREKLQDISEALNENTYELQESIREVQARKNRSGINVHHQLVSLVLTMREVVRNA